MKHEHLAVFAVKVKSLFGALLRKPSTSFLVATPIAYHVVLAYLYGAELLDSPFPDVWGYVSTGLYLVGEEVAVCVRDMPLVLPLFCGTLYIVLGFPTFLYYLWFWNAAIMSLAIVSAYALMSKLYDRKTGVLAALLLGFNWNAGYYGQLLLVDFAWAAFALASLAFLVKYLGEREDERSLLLSGVLAAVACWTKFVAFYTYLPIFFGLMLAKKLTRRALGIGLAGFVLGSLFFMLVCLLRYGNPIEPILNEYRVIAPKGEVRLEFTPQYFAWVHKAIGFLPHVLMFVGVAASLAKRKFLLPIWAHYGILVYSFGLLTVCWQYTAHMMFLFALLAAVGEAALFDAAYRIGRRGLRVLALALVGTLCVAAVANTNYLFMGYNLITSYDRTIRDSIPLHKALEKPPREQRLAERFLALKPEMTIEKVASSGYPDNCAYSILLVSNDLFARRLALLLGVVALAAAAYVLRRSALPKL